MVVAPTFIEFRLAVDRSVSVADLFAFAMDELVEQADFEPKYWDIHSETKAAKRLGDFERPGRPSRGDFDELGAACFEQGFSIYGQESGLAFMPRTEGAEESYGGQAHWEVWNMNLGGSGSEEEQGCRLIRDCQRKLRLTRAALEGFPCLGVELKRDDQLDFHGGLCPPFFDCWMLIKLVDPADIAEAYRDSDLYWSVWDQVTELADGRRLVHRELETLDAFELCRRSLAPLFKLARAAKPGLTEFYEPTLGEREAKYVAGMATYLKQIGYDASDKSLEFTAVVQEGEHLSPADIYRLIKYAESGAADGSEIEALKVTFVDEAMALREAPLLHDMGVRVQFFGEDGAWKVLAKPA